MSQLSACIDTLPYGATSCCSRNRHYAKARSRALQLCASAYCAQAQLVHTRDVLLHDADDYRYALERDTNNSAAAIAKRRTLSARLGRLDLASVSGLVNSEHDSGNHTPGSVTSDANTNSTHQPAQPHSRADGSEQPHRPPRRRQASALGRLGSAADAQHSPAGQDSDGPGSRRTSFTASGTDNTHTHKHTHTYTQCTRPNTHLVGSEPYIMKGG